MAATCAVVEEFLFPKSEGVHKEPYWHGVVLASSHDGTLLLVRVVVKSVARHTIVCTSADSRNAAGGQAPDEVTVVAICSPCATQLVLDDHITPRQRQNPELISNFFFNGTGYLDIVSCAGLSRENIPKYIERQSPVKAHVNKLVASMGKLLGLCTGRALVLDAQSMHTTKELVTHGFSPCYVHVPNNTPHSSTIDHMRSQCPGAAVVQCECDEYLHSTPHTFSVMYLDFCGTFSKLRGAVMCAIGKIDMSCHNAVFAVTLCARDSVTKSDAMHEMEHCAQACNLEFRPVFVGSSQRSPPMYTVVYHVVHSSEALSQLAGC